MTNQFRSTAFIKIKQTIQKSINALHLQTCRVMIENSTSILSKDELTILKEYLLSAWDRINPVGLDLEEDSIQSLYHQRLSPQ